MGSGSSGERQRDDADEPVQVRPYDPEWPARFDDERHLLLDSKPIIDILVGVRDLESTRPCIGLVAPLGYLYAPYRADEMHWFCKPDPSRRTHHLHLVPVTFARFQDELRFRDYLRSHRQVRADYARLKHSLAERFRWDRDAYTQSKTAFVQDVLRRGATTG